MKSNFYLLMLITLLCGLLILNGCGRAEDTSENTNNAKAGKTESSEQSDVAEPDKKVNNNNSATEKEPKTEKESIKTKPIEKGLEENTFIPKGWEKIDTVKGDLNKDSLEDSVLQLAKKDSDGGEEKDRMLIILFKVQDGNFIKAGESKNLLLCSSCGGMLGMGGKANIGIKNSVLTISQLSGSRDATDHLHRFRYEPNSKKFRLIGEDIENFDRATGASTTTSTNYLTGKQIITKKQFNEKTNNDDVVSKEEKNVGSPRKYLQNVIFR